MKPVRTVILPVVALLALTGCSWPPAHARITWVDREITFQFGGMTVYGTYRHPGGHSETTPAALLIAGSGPTDRNGNDPAHAHMDTLRSLAEKLSDDGVSSLRYDKLGTGRTGLGPYQGHLADLGLAPFTQEATDALGFLAAQPGVDRDRLTVVGHSEGALYGLLLATSDRPPRVGAVALLEPLARRFLDLLQVQIDASLDKAVQAGKITQAQAQARKDAAATAVASIRTTGTVPAGLPGDLAQIFSPTSARYLQEIDRYDPADVVARLPAGTRMLTSCSDADIQVSCADVDRLTATASTAGLHPDAVHLTGVDHVLKEETAQPPDYDAPAPFSRQLTRALHDFLRTTH